MRQYSPDEHLTRRHENTVAGFWICFTKAVSRSRVHVVVERIFRTPA